MWVLSEQYKNSLPLPSVVKSTTVEVSGVLSPIQVLISPDPVCCKHKRAKQRANQT